ncbi:3-hydroxyacyl-CoA dehydrogenase family protein [Mycolicibacterium holsaticum]|uniref:3-hydroxybutyryl-CoA dehydrogenase n=1 Tax=Mycolicibacterium holsaticum TaxID=152142 RepID=A0A1E3RWZ9_9MYCO|nr:3-hydroxyacyl-CoA dehydrogenase family protein [Mycolicibacterium holsaticum]ODQ94389.1 3-hydroxybutyryl-CoA dehydrogenase [Mycolicibacterium holsaticum]
MTQPRSPLNVSVIGAGTMGSGIAITSLLGAHNVCLIDVDDERIELGKEQVAKFLARSLSLGKISESDHAAATGRLSASTSLKSARDADIVIEAVFEDVEVKQALFAELDAICRPDTLFHTNTSTLSVTAIAAGSERPDRVVGTHYCNPAPLMKLVEVVPGRRSADEAIRRSVAYIESIGKSIVTAKDVPGFIVNRLLVPFENDCIRALQAGRADVETIDAAVTLALGYPMGPFKLLDTVGLDIHYAVSMSLFTQLHNPRFAPPPLVTQMIAAGDLGRKTGRGFYSYEQKLAFGA